MTRFALVFSALIAFAALIPDIVRGAEHLGGDRFREQVRPILETHCFGCHGDGSSEGGRTLDAFDSDEAMLGNVELWWAVLKNVRAGLMPPAGEERPSNAERKQLLDWIEGDVFRIDPANPDPGRVTLRRLNRVEYRNTIRDLMGVDFDASAEFPPDDSGFGFDNIGDALSLSPLLLEKYMQAAETIVAKSVPTMSKVVAEEVHPGRLFVSEDGNVHGNELSFYEPAKVAATIPIKQAAKYRIVVEARIDGYYELDPGKCEVICEFDGKERFKNEYDWRDDLSLSYEFEEQLDVGDHPMSFALKPLVPADQKIKYLNYRVERIRVQGPLDETAWVPPPNYARFFPNGPPPAAGPERDEFARQVLAAFATRAYRRSVESDTVDRLVGIAKPIYEQPSKSFEQGIAQAMVAVLASPRFLFRVEEPAAAGDDAQYPLVDEYALASRLSYFLWSTMPDEQLLGLAARNELRANLPAQLERMLKDPRSNALVENFTGQWLQARDVETMSIDPVAALGYQKEWEEILDKVRAIRRSRRRGENRREQNKAEKTDAENSDEPKVSDEKAAEEAERDKIMAEFRKFRELRDQFSGDVRTAMRRETELSFDYVMRQDRSVLELLDCDYAFLNEPLAKHYGIPGVEGDEMRRVTLPEGSPRGGLLTQGTTLVVTSNPTRTSPVKRGLFLLDNVLGTPAPPPPAAVPPLEASADAIADHPPTIREALERHRSDPLCAGCHARMDPLGFALENFNALGTWRDQDNKQPIDTSGELITGEKFQNLAELKKILVREHKLDFYRCLTEKLLTYALGRGLEYYDEATVDRIVGELDQNDGRFGVLLREIVAAPAFQRERRMVDEHQAVEVNAASDGSQVQVSVAQGNLP